VIEEEDEDEDQDENRREYSEMQTSPFQNLTGETPVPLS
jgi:hypothetical protein